MENIPNRIRERKTSLIDWSVTSTVVTTMRRIVGSSIKNQASSGKWIIPGAIVDNVGVYINFSGDGAYGVLKVKL